MKKSILTISLLLLTTISCCQENEDTPCDFYVSAGLSMTNSFDTTFSYSSYPSIEVGFMKNNFSLGAVFGRASLSGFNADRASNYWYELKTAISFPIEKMNAYGLLGIGNYFSTNRIFIEYGLGFSYSVNNFSMFGQASNWDGTWYITPGIGYTFPHKKK